MLTKIDFNTNTKEKLTAILFLVVVFVMLAIAFFSIRPIESQFFQSYRKEVTASSNFVQRITAAIDSADIAINSGKYRPAFIEIYGLAQKTMNRKVISDLNYGEVYKTPYNQITFASKEVDVTGDLKGINKLKNELDEMGIPLLYVQTPFKLPANEQQLPINVTDYANQNADNFLQGLARAGIDNLDLRPGFWSSGMSQNQLFYDTDHHWTIDGAFYSLGDIVDKLNQDYHFTISSKYSDISYFQRKTYKEFFIGTEGRRVGRIYGGIDDFTLITPDFATNYTLYERENGSEKIYEGTFEEAVLINSYLDENAPLDTNRYAVYHGDNAELLFVNHNINNGRILMVKDSFALPVYSLLSLGVHEIAALDVRLFTGSISGYAKKYKPDVVMVIYNADIFESDMMFDYDSK